jgi:two-component system cell cycle sensor histidine kinase/response regulator CckA
VEVQEIKRAGERASALTKQLLAFGRRQIIKPQILDLNQAIDQTGKLLRRLIGEDIQLTFDLDPKLGHVHADPGQIDQIIVNLAVNARDAMPQGGKLLIRTQNVVLAPSDVEEFEIKTGEYIMLTIADTGHGMSKEVQNKIFEPFFTTKERGKGTGLGLATVYGIVKQNEGGIHVHSTQGFGTTFKIFLPHQEENAAGINLALPAGESAAPEGNGETILLVEDEPLVSNRVARVLRRKGYDVFVAANAAEAIKLMERRDEPVDLVLTDVVMPEMNGREMMAVLHQKWPDLRVLYMSGYPAEIIAQHGVLESGIKFIEKPFYTDEICQRIKDIIGV